MLGFGQRVVVTENPEDVIGLSLMEPNLRGEGSSEYSARMDLLNNAREIGAIILYHLRFSSRLGFDRRHDGFTYFGRAYGPRKDS